MTLVSDILTAAYRESNLIALSGSPTTAQQTEALNRFNPLVASVLGWEAGENLRQWPVGTAGYHNPPDCYRREVWQYPLINSAMVLNLTQAETVYLPEKPSDGARVSVQDLANNLATYNLTLDGNGRLVESARTLVLSANGLNRTWFYRADLGDWRRVSTLATSDEMPFPIEFDDMFIIMLAIRLNPRYGRKLDEQTAITLRRAQSMFSARYAQAQDLRVKPDLDLRHMSDQGYNGFFDGDDAIYYRSS